MTEIPKLGYLLPGFPAQSHSRYWREILKLESLGVEVVVFSDHPDETVVHSWAKGAEQRTQYLTQTTLSARLAALPRLPWRHLRQGRGGVDHWRAVTQAAPLARHLAHMCADQDIYHVHVPGCGDMALVMALAQRLYGIDYSLHLDRPLAEAGVAQHVKWGGARFASVGSQTILDDLTVRLGADMPSDVTVHPLGVDTAYLRRDRPYRAREVGKPLRLIASADLAADKGHDALLQAVLHLQSRDIEVHLEILGEDADGGAGFRAELEHQVAELGLIGTVFIPGAMSDDTLRDRLCAAHVYVMSSPAEITETAVLEAMSCECPVVAVECESVNQMITNGLNGILVGPADTIALASALEYLAFDPARAAQVGQAGRKRVMEAADVAASASRLITQIGLELPEAEEGVQGWSMPEKQLAKF
ncbi:glycosyltransferase family 4 protein [Thalassobius sp. Cn5-15]|uniref:glycosyltransferase family 4 protein n=1 Tax=Thalassobius sp. Cn5-15 TaxID=2917763 RepID=UPI001EF18902|nr:glycosyltransferase family 4 protein [Thalassobius sp. Cn5-15]